MTENQAATSSRRMSWLIGGALALLILGGGAGLWLFKEAHHPRTVVMPATLLGLSRYTGPGAASDAHYLAQAARTELDVSGSPVVGLYGNVPGQPALAVVATPPCGGGTCVLPTPRQVVQSMKNAGDVFFAGGFASSLADAAVETRQVRAAVERT